MSTIKIGVIAKDIVTGFTGVVTAYAVHLSNCDRAFIQPRELKEDGSPKDAHYFDVPQLEYVDMSDVPIIEPVYTNIHNGDKVCHNIIPFKGTVIGINTWINGCVRIGVQTSHMEKGSPLDEVWYPCQELTLIEPQVIPEPEKEKKVGGPMKAPKAVSNPK